jgi:predicted AlkP superfamily pyrophosphatase or phosphodiesterase
MNMRKTVVMNVVGLTPRLLGPATPHLSRFVEQGKLATIDTVLPAVTCSVQATFLTGRYPIFGTSQRSISGDNLMR